MKTFFNLFLLVVALPVIASATTYVPLSNSDLVIGSRAIVTGRVAGIASAKVKGRIYTYVTIDVEQIVKGEAPARIVLRELGGTVGDETLTVWGNPQFQVGEEALLFLDTWADGALRTYHMFLGKRAPPEVEEFHQLVEELAHASQVWETLHYPTPISPVPDELDGSLILTPSFTFISSSRPRWFEPDDGIPVVFVVRPDGSFHPDPLPLVSRGMASWSTVEGSALVLNNGGFNSQCLPGGGTNTIVFDNCDGRFSPSPSCSGLLALGGVISTSSQTKIINGLVFTRILTGFVSFNPFADCHFTDSCNFVEVMTHELGHAIGLGHSTVADASMRAQAYFNGRCERLGTDDQEAMVFIYPGEQPPPDPEPEPDPVPPPPDPEPEPDPVPEPDPLQITTLALDPATEGIFYFAQFLAVGGVEPYTWSTFDTLPAGLELTQSGLLQGVPTESAGSNDPFLFTVRVQDTVGTLASQLLGLIVFPKAEDPPPPDPDPDPPPPDPDPIPDPLAPVITKIKVKRANTKLVVFGEQFGKKAVLEVDGVIRATIFKQRLSGDRLVVKSIPLTVGLHAVRIISKERVSALVVFEVKPLL